jgi:isopenicillin-N epimerase
MLDPAVTFLNHGSFGSCPRPVFEFQQAIRERMERQPVQFFVRDLEVLWDGARAELARFIGADVDDLVFVPNATAGVNTVLRSLEFRAGDELLVTDHEYNACRNALDFVAERTGARVVIARIPFPLRGAEEIVEAILNCATERTRLALLDHVTSQTALVFPIERIVRELAERGIDTLVDGAHAPGMVPLRVREIGAAYYTGNCHKWICAPKGAGFLCVRPDRQQSIRPLVISHGANSPRRDRSRFLIEFAWSGTWDPSPCLSVPEALRIMGSLFPGGWTELMQRNHQLVLSGRKILCEALKIEPPCPIALIGSMTSLALPAGVMEKHPTSPLYSDPLQDKLRIEYGIEVPIIPWPAATGPVSVQPRLLRISAQIYNAPDQYEMLAAALRRLLSF